MLSRMAPIMLGQLAAGLILLVAGGNLLVRSTSRLAVGLGVSPLVIGLTVVAFGTSAPELAVSFQSADAGLAGLTVGNVVGSNIFNVLFILGLSATITPLLVHQRFVHREVPLLIVVSGVTWALCASGRIGVGAGAVLLLGLVAYTVLAIRGGRREARLVVTEYAHEFGTRTRSWGIDAVVALVALGLLVLGSSWFVTGASHVARSLGVSELTIGLLIVAPGTSLPEVATSLIAAFKGERDIAVGNVIGSNLFNLLGVLGVTAVAQGGIAVPEAALRFDIPVMFGATLACLPVFLTGHCVTRWEGAALLAYYAAYVAWLVSAASGYALRDAFGVALFGFALPLTAVGLIASLIAARRRRG